MSFCFLQHSLIYIYVFHPVLSVFFNELSGFSLMPSGSREPFTARAGAANGFSPQTSVPWGNRPKSEPGTWLTYFMISKNKNACYCRLCFRSSACFCLKIISSAEFKRRRSRVQQLSLGRKKKETTSETSATRTRRLLLFVPELKMFVGLWRDETPAEHLLSLHTENSSLRRQWSPLHFHSAAWWCWWRLRTESLK